MFAEIFAIDRLRYAVVGFLESHFSEFFYELNAVNLYDDDSLDFVLIDGSHAYNDVHDDITAWLKKLKPGSLLAGDDYEWPGVKQAVNELLPGFTHFPIIGCWAYFKP